MCKGRFGWAHVDSAGKCVLRSSYLNTEGGSWVVLCLSLQKGVIRSWLPGFSFKPAMPKLIPAVLCSCRDCRQVLYVQSDKITASDSTWGWLVSLPSGVQEIPALAILCWGGWHCKLGGFGLLHPDFGTLLDVRPQLECAFPEPRAFEELCAAAQWLRAFCCLRSPALECCWPQ